MHTADPALSRQRVLFISSPESPGADTFIHALLMRELDRTRFEVHVAGNSGPRGGGTPAFAALSAIPDVHLRPTDFGPSLSGRPRIKQAALALGALPAVASLAGLAAYIRRNRISVLHSTDRPRDALPCVLLGKLTGAKSVVHAHLGYGDWMSPAVKWSFAHADARLCISQYVAGSLVEHGCPPQRTYVALNSIDASAWDPTVSGGPVRRELGLAALSLVITCIARVFPAKGQSDLIRALPLIMAEVPEASLLIVGGDDRSATPGGGSFTEELRSLAAGLGVAGHIRFAGFRRDTAAILAATDVFAMPSFGEPFGLVYLEAMAMRRPVVGLNNGGTKEVVEDGKSGLLCPPEDIPALAAAIVSLLRDPGLRERMGAYGRRQVETRFTPRRMARQTEQAYVETLRR